MPVTPTARTGLRLRRLLDPPGEGAQATGAFLQRVGHFNQDVDKCVLRHAVRGRLRIPFPRISVNELSKWGRFEH